MSLETKTMNKSTSNVDVDGTLGRVVSSVMNLSSLFVDDASEAPSAVAESEISYDDETEYENGDLLMPGSKMVQLPSKKLQWDFYGLTIWLELEEFDNDITNAIHDMSAMFDLEVIPKSHTTAIYGMTHLTIQEARERLHLVKSVLKDGKWPKFARPTAIVQDIARAGRPGQVCDVAWCELTLSTNPEHEDALDALYELFFFSQGKGEGIDSNEVHVERNRPWKPHNSFAYDNPENSPLSLESAIEYVAMHPTLISKERRVEAISLWDTNGKMGEWKCLDRVYF